METKGLNPVTDIIVMTTGGTIEKTYDEGDGSLLNRESEIHNWIKQTLRLPYKSIRVISVMSKDSLHMTDYDRILFLKSLEVQLQKNVPIVVLHGTDTMTKTASYCFNHLKNPPVPVIFTGAMRPKGFVDSDAAQNVAEALMVSQLVGPGYYISFHSRLYNVPNAKKNLDKRTFEQI